MSSLMSLGSGKFFFFYLFLKSILFTHRLCRMAHTAPYDREKEKKGPRHIINVSWAVGKFFLSFLIYSTNCFFFTNILHNMMHTALYNREKEKVAQDMLSPCPGLKVSFFIIFLYLFY